MSKTIEGIIHSVGYTQDGTKANFSFNEAMLIAKRYAQSKTQELQEQNAELVMTLQSVYNLLDVDAKISLDSIRRILTKHKHLNQM